MKHLISDIIVAIFIFIAITIIFMGIQSVIYPTETNILSGKQTESTESIMGEMPRQTSFIGMEIADIEYLWYQQHVLNNQ